MNVAVFVATALGMAVGAVCVPATRRQLAAAMARSTDDGPALDVPGGTFHRIALIVASGLLPGLVVFRAGWSIVAIPPLLLLVGLVHLAYCDMTRFLLPKTMVHVTSACVAASVLTVGWVHDDWHRVIWAGVGGLALFAFLLVINLMNPAWMAFGDVRLAFAVGMGLGWISGAALLQTFIVANVLAAVAGLVMIAAHRGQRTSALPFGLYLALASAVVIFVWS